MGATGIFDQQCTLPISLAHDFRAFELSMVMHSGGMSKCIGVSMWQVTDIGRPAADKPIEQFHTLVLLAPSLFKGNNDTSS